MSKRIDYLDIAKGLSILFVVLHHSRLKHYAPDVVAAMGLFRMPFFFFVSGLFFRSSVNTLSFLVRKADVLLKPYFTTMVLILLLSLITKKSDISSFLLGMFYANGETIPWIALWFLPHLFAVSVFGHFVIRIRGIQDWGRPEKLIFVLALIALGSLIIDLFWHRGFTFFGRLLDIPGLPFSVDLIPITGAFFIAGVFMSKQVMEMTPRPAIMILSATLFLAVAFLTDAHVDLNKREYINPAYATVGAFCGIYLALSLSFYIDKVRYLRNTLLAIGTASLFILIFHGRILHALYRQLARSGIPDYDFLYALIAFVASIGVSILIKMAISRSPLLSLFYLPIRMNRAKDQIEKRAARQYE